MIANREERAPGPAGFVRPLVQFVRDPFGYLAQLARFGDVVRVPAARGFAHLLNHPQDIEHVLVRNNKNYRKDRILRNTKSLFGNGLLASEGDFWLGQRRLMQPMFHRERIAEYAAAMAEMSAEHARGWQHGEVRDMHAEMSGLALRIAVKTLFGAEGMVHAQTIGEALNAVSDHLRGFVRVAFNLPEWLRLPGDAPYRYAVAALDDVVNSIIDAQRQTPPANHLLAMLLASRDDSGAAMSQRQLRDEVLTLLLAGHETSALALTYAFYLLAKNPHCRIELDEELDRVLSGRPPTAADIAALPYTGQVIKEAMRLYPPVFMFGREAIAGDDIGGFHVGEKSMVLISPWVVHRDARFYDSPEEFFPGRWSESFERALPKFAYLPFGGGPRLCIGANFAAMEMRIALATLCQRFVPALVSDNPLELQASVTVRPKNGLAMRILSRSQLN
jgi:cytochrome P450